MAMRPEDREKLLQGILQRTSGSPCRRAETLLPDVAEGSLDATDRRLLDLHLERCAGCRSLAAVLAWMPAPLAGLAEVDPGPAFTAAVLARTRRRPSPWKSWLELWRRPRFAWEAAYVGAMLLGLVFAAPASPLRQVPGRALHLAQTNPLPAAAREWSAEAWDAGAGRVAGTAVAWRDGLWSRLSAAWDAGRPLPGQIGGLGAAVLDGEGTADAFGRLRGTVGQVWSRAFGPRDSDPTSNKDSSGERS